MGEKESLVEIPQPAIFSYDVEVARNAVAKRHAYWLATLAPHCNEAITSGAEGQISPFGDAWRLFANLPAHVQYSALLEPTMGTWLAYVKRQTSPDAGKPLEWGHAGYFYNLVAAAAIRAGIDFELTLPAWDSNISLPGMATVSVPRPRLGRWSSATISLQNGQIHIGDPEDPQLTFDHHEVGKAHAARRPLIRPWLEVESRYRPDPGMFTWSWVPLPSVAVARGEGKPPFTLTLDSRDPYRKPGDPLPPVLDQYEDYLSRAEEAGWLQQLRAGMELLVANHPELTDRIAPVLHRVVPSRQTSIPFRAASSSAGDAPGATVLGQQFGAEGMANALVHEGHHNWLYGLMAHARLFEPGAESGERLYTGWRDDPRHPYGALHGVVSFVAVTEFHYQRLLRSDLPPAERQLDEFAFGYWHKLVQKVHQQLQHGARFTPEGQSLMVSLSSRIEAMGSLLINEGLREKAQEAAAYHGVRWLAEHSILSKNLGKHLTALFLEGRDDEPALTRDVRSWFASQQPYHLEFNPKAHRFDIWFVLGSMALANPEALHSLLQTPDRIPEWIQGASEADVRYFAGDIDGAIARYKAQLTSPFSYDTPAAVVGLGTAAKDGDPELAILLHAPQLYLHIQREVTALNGEPAPPAWVGRFLWEIIERR
jgi:HEXXH motif-containing protein